MGSESTRGSFTLDSLVSDKPCHLFGEGDGWILGGYCYLMLFVDVADIAEVEDNSGYYSLATHRCCIYLQHPCVTKPSLLA